MLTRYLARHGWHVPVVCDPSRAAYRAFGLERTGWLTFFRPRVLAKYMRGMFRGHGVKTPYEGEDVLQLGGDFVLDRLRRVVFAYPSADPTDRPAVAALLSAVVRDFGWLDILDNVAGRSGRFETATMAEADWDTIIDGNLKGTFLACKHAIPHLRARGGGRIINMVSLNGVNAHMGSLEYNAAKEALRALTRTAAREWAPTGVTVNAIAPAAKSQAFLRALGEYPELVALADAANPMGRMGDPYDDIAPVAVFLASEGSRYLTGNTLFVDGGSHINGVAWAPDLDAE